MKNRLFNLKMRLAYTWYCLTSFFTWDVCMYFLGKAQNGNKFCIKIVSNSFMQKIFEFAYTQVKERDEIKEFCF